MRLCMVVEDQRSLYVINAVLRALNPSPLLVPGLCTASALFKLDASLLSDDNRIRWQAGGLLTALPCHKPQPERRVCSTSPTHLTHSSNHFSTTKPHHYETTPNFSIRTMPPANPSTTETHEEESWLCQGCTWINKGGSYCASCGYPRSAGD